MLPKHYRQLSDASVSTINDVKDLEQRLLDSIVGDSTEAEQARINIRQGVMWAVLNITKSEPAPTDETESIWFLPRVSEESNVHTLIESWGPSLVTWTEFSVENTEFDFFALSDKPDQLHTTLLADRLALISVNGESLEHVDKYSTTSFSPDGTAWLMTDNLVLSFNYRTGTMKVEHHTPEVKSFGVCFYAHPAQ